MESKEGIMDKEKKETGVEKVRFDVSGMSCAACSARVEKCVSSVDGVKNVSVNLLTGGMVVEMSDDVAPEKIIDAVKGAGYGAKKHQADVNKTKSTEKNAVGTAETELKKMKLRLVVSLVFWVPLMIVSMGRMFLERIGVPVPEFLTKAFYAPESAVAFAVVQILLLTPILVANQQYFKRGFYALFKRSPNMDTLVAIGASAAVLYGIFALFRIGYGLGYGNIDIAEKYSRDLYFESAGTILTLITLGKFLEAKSKGKTSEAITKLMKLAPETVNVVRDGKEVEVKAEEVREGEIFIVRPGERVAVDGVITEGSSSFDESAVTGESIPVEKKEGDSLISASVNGSGFVKAKATQVGKNTTIAKIIALVEEASSAKAPIAKLADKISGVFVPIVMLIALAAFVGWISGGYGLEFALARGISVLVISCPCALGLATPVAIMVGTGKGAENGILIKSGESLETLHSVDTVVFDKTGTLTEGKPSVTDIAVFGKSTENETLALAFSLEKMSEHPLASAIVAECESKGIESFGVSDFTAVAGMGIRGKIGNETVFVGNKAFAETFGAADKDAYLKLTEFSENGKTPLIVGKGNKISGIIAVSDKIKESGKEAVEELKKEKVGIVMLTGDNEITARAVAAELGISEVVAGVLPDLKEKKIKELKSSGRKTAMVGDGINDAPALASADVGIAIGAGTDIAVESADVVLVRNDLRCVPDAVRLSRAVVRNIKQNLFWAFIYNGIGIPVAAGVLYPFTGIALSPMIGAAAMSLSSVCVVMNALRLKTLRLGGKKINTVSENSSSSAVILKVRGMTCPHCEKRVTDALLSAEGVKSARADFVKGIAEADTLFYVDRKILIEKIKEAGYKAK